MQKLPWVCNQKLTVRPVMRGRHALSDAMIRYALQQTTCILGHPNLSLAIVTGLVGISVVASHQFVVIQGAHLHDPL